jgi:hypothetical protein
MTNTYRFIQDILLLYSGDPALLSASIDVNNALQELAVNKLTHIVSQKQVRIFNQIVKISRGCDIIFAIKSEYSYPVICTITIGAIKINEFTLQPGETEWLLNGNPLIMVCLPFNEAYIRINRFHNETVEVILPDEDNLFVFYNLDLNHQHRDNLLRNLESKIYINLGEKQYSYWCIWFEEVSQPRETPDFMELPSLQTFYSNYVLK